MLVLQLAEHVFVGQSTIGISLFKLETPYADPHVRCCERCDAKTSAYSIVLNGRRVLHQALYRIRKEWYSLLSVTSLNQHNVPVSPFGEETPYQQKTWDGIRTFHVLNTSDMP